MDKPAQGNGQTLPSKILERIIQNRLLPFLVTPIPLQFGFRPCSSTQEVLIYANHDEQSHLDRVPVLLPSSLTCQRPLIWFCAPWQTHLYVVNPWYFLVHFLSGFQLPHWLTSESGIGRSLLIPDTYSYWSASRVYFRRPPEFHLHEPTY